MLESILGSLSECL